MRKILTAAILGLAALTGAAGAEANDGARRVPPPLRAPERRQDAPRGEHRRVPAPRFERVYAGRDACGRAVTHLVRLPEHPRSCD